MKHMVLTLLVMAFALAAPAQLLKNISNRAKQKVEQKASQKVDKAIDNAVDGNGQPPAATEAAEKTDTGADGVQPAAVKTEGLKAYSKYDFVQGEKLVAFEDFSNAAVGDFPTRWNTNGSGEIVTLNKKEGKWLKIDKEGFFHAEFINNLPQNSTLEFDLGVNDNFSWYNQTMQLYITQLDNPADFSKGYYYGKHTIEMELHPYRDAMTKTGKVWIRSELNGNATINNDAPVKQWNISDKSFAHVSLWRQGQRLRVYINGDKIFDLPRAFDAAGVYNAVIFQSQGFHNESSDYYLLGNIRLASGAPDTRNKLITEGKFVTSGISFDVNSDQLKPESFGVLKEVAGVLTENPGIAVKIIGHTDSDGAAAANLELSKRRAAAVKRALVQQFAVDGERLTTDGAGASKPVGSNGTPEGKAQNRRVEFVKL